MSRIYLDDAGSAPVLPEVCDALRDLPEGNPSSPHSEGRAARAALDRARDAAAAALGVRRTEVSFVSSGTEAVNLALFGVAARLSRGPIVTWAAERQSVLATVRRLQTSGREAQIFSVVASARVDPDAVEPGTSRGPGVPGNSEVGPGRPGADIL